MAKENYKRTKNWHFIPLKAYRILELKLNEKEKTSIRLQAKQTATAMYLEDKNYSSTVAGVN